VVARDAAGGYAMNNRRALGHEEVQAGERAAVAGRAGAGVSTSEEALMPSDETRRLLKLFGVAVTNLEDAIDARKPMDEIMKWDQELAERTREVIAHVEKLRSRRIA
jgi:hypothetical protein